MKTKLKTPQAPATALAARKPAQRYLKHILSPLELAAIAHNYKAFNYTLAGTTVAVSVMACKQLLLMSTQKIDFFTGVIYKESLSRSTTGKVMLFLDEPLANLPLPPYLKNRLRSICCYTLFDVVKLGKHKVMHSRGFGKAAMRELDSLFKRHRCSGLFK